MFVCLSAGYSGNYSIPDNITNIVGGAFASQRNLTSVTIPNSVTRIGNEAFYDCWSLTSITIPNSVTSIGYFAFSGCISLENTIIVNDMLVYVPKCEGNYSIPDNITTIVGGAFAYKVKMTSVSIPNSVTSIGEYAFLGCNGLTLIDIPNSVTSIGSSAFDNCSGLSSVTIPNSVKKIGEFAFIGCTGMKSVSIPNSVTTIEEGVFEHCGLLSVDIPNSVTSIGSQAFRGCDSLRTVNIPNSVTSIGASAFDECDSLRTVNIPNSVTSIGASAFCDCKNLKTITIPNSVTSIGLFAFLHAAIETLYYDCTDDPQVINTTLKNLYIGDNLTNVCDYFKRNQLQKIVLGKKVSQIEEGAFESSEIEEFTITGEEPPYCSANIFGTQDLSNATLFVPEGKAEYYKTTAPWSGFGKIKELEGTIVDTVKNRGVSLHLSDGMIILSGLNTNEIVILYSTDGKELGAVKAIDGSAQFAAQSGSVVVAKIGVECVKIAVK